MYCKPIILPERQIARFHTLYRRGGPDECWLWIGSLNHDNYGLLCVSHGRAVHHDDYLAHRIAWTLAHGPIPPGLLVCHSCDTRYAIDDLTYRRCCNPAHHWLGTIAQNSADKVAKGRVPWGDRTGTHTHPDAFPRGQDKWAAKLTDDQVREIRRLHAGGGWTHRSLAARFEVGKSTIGGIVSREYWRHVA